MIKVGFDSDGVIYNYVLAFHSYLRDFCGMSDLDVELKADQWNWFEKHLGITTEQYKEFHERGVQAGEIFWKGVLLDPGIPDQMQRLLDAGHEVNIVTYRLGEKAEEGTFFFLAENKIPFTQVIFSKDKTVIHNDFFLEDNLDNYDSLDAAGVEVYLLDCPYNHVENDNRRRVSSVKEYVDIILGE